jgi:iron complex outermembrane receptor protein
MNLFTKAAAALAAAALVLVPLCLTAQDPSAGAHLTGSLADRSGAVLSGATITLRTAKTGVSWTTKTDLTGRFAFTRLAAGSYSVSVQQGGYSTLVRAVELHPGEMLEMPLVLSIASVVQQVEVTGEPTNDGLDSASIRESAARDLGEALDGIAGVDKVRKAAIANDIAIRGLVHNDIALSFDGARLYGACTGQMDPAAYHVDLAEVDHVDVVKGPFDVSTQGALGGFVKVITRTPELTGLAFDASVAAGSYGYYNPSAVLEGGNAVLQVLGGYSYRTSEFYTDGNGEKVSALGGYRSDAENLQAFRTQSGWTRIAFAPAHDQRGEITYARQQSGIVLYPYMMMDGVFDNADRFTARYDLLRSQGTVRRAHGLAWVDKINHLMDNRLRSSSGSLPASMLAQVVSFSSGARFDMDLTGGITGGYEFQRRYWNSNGWIKMSMMGTVKTTASNTLPGITQDVQGAYVAYRRPVGSRLLVTAGGRFDHAYTNASQADPALYLAYHGTSATTASDSGLSGNVQFSWQAQPELLVFAGIGSNIRFPDQQELFFHSDSSMGNGWVGNPLLTHPRNTEYDLGITAKSARFSLSPHGFFSALGNDIVLYAATRTQAVSGVQSAQAQSYAGVSAHRWGGELAAAAPLGSRFAAEATLSYVRGTKVPQPANNIRSSNLFQVPPLRAQFNLRYERGAFHAGALALVTGRQDHVDADENEKQTAGFSVFGLSGGYRAKRIRAEAGINNAFAREYSEYLSYARNPYTNGVRLPEPGRNFFINLSYRVGRAPVNSERH